MLIEITYDPAWRSPVWDEHVPSRPAYFIHCQECGELSEGWGHAQPRTAKTSATRHMRRYHEGERVQVIDWHGLLIKAQGVAS